MSGSRLIQGVALAFMVVGATVSGRLLVPILDMSERNSLRYTDVSVEGAPPFVVLGTAIGALRGLIVDYLWIKVNVMKERGLFYEVMADAELITKLQPRFAAVWAFHGHNMAYNISVATHTREERWSWVNAGIRLVREQGLRHNPNDLLLHKELAFWFAHKIAGYSDDAHLFYKREFCREWNDVLGTPPEDQEERIAWIQAIADAPRTVEEAERLAPGVKALIERLDNALAPFGDQELFAPNKRFLKRYGDWRAVTEQSSAAKILGIEQRMQLESGYFRAFSEIATDPEVAEAWDVLLRYVRRRVLLDEYNMDPALMAEYTRDLGPIDWRNAQAHALYWARRGSQLGEDRVFNEEDIYKVINNDRMQIQALQGLARFGRITFDPFSSDIPSQYSEPRFIDTIEKMFAEIYSKHYETRGAGAESFIDFLKNFMGSAIREAYRAGEHARAERLLKALDDRFGSGAVPPNPMYQVPLDVFVRNQVKDEYEMQPHIAPSEAVASMRSAFRMGVGRDDRETYEQAVQFVNGVIEMFRTNEYNNFVNKWGEGRMKDLIQNLETTSQRTFVQLMTDPTVSIVEKRSIWEKIDRYQDKLRIVTYDAIRPSLERQFAANEVSRSRSFEEVFPEPPGLDLFRQQMEARRLELEKLREQERSRDDFAPRGQ